MYKFIKPIWKGLKNLYNNLKNVIAAGWKKTNVIEKITFGLLAASACIYFPSLSCLVGASIFNTGDTHSLISLAIMSLVYFIFYFIAAFSAELIIPFVFIAFCEWYVWCEDEYKNTCARSI